ncbi:MAG TPA: ABC transporter substrate-binding protein [Acidimicrobiales bacterium]|nr:ABC transporter substrate-binding protein [Acidimicrobiales bacterium]
MPDRIDRRSFLARGALGAAGVAAAGTGAGGLLAACSSGPGSGSPGASKPSGSRNGITSATPKKGGSLTFGVEAEEQGFDPATGRFDETGVLYARTVFDPLTIVAEDGSVQPYLAKSVTPNESYDVWTIGVRPGVKFHDGTDCDAAAIAGSIEHFLTGELGITLTPSLKKVGGITVTDPNTVTINLIQPWVPFPTYLTGGIGGQGGYIVAPSMIADKNGGSNPVGTGPFIFDKWVPNDHFSSKRNPNYWRTGLPYLDEITYKPIVDADSRSSALKAGTIDIMHNDVPEVILQYRDDTSFGYVDDSQHVVGEPDMNFVMLNLSMAPMDNIKVRTAMAMSVNSKQFSTVVDKGVNAPTNQPFVAGSPYYATDSGYPAYNPSGAKALVDEVARETGSPVSFTLISTTSGSSIKAAQFLQQQFQTAGMQVTLQQVQQADEINDALAGKFQAVEWRQFAAVDPDLNYLWWSPTEIFGSINPNFAQNKDPKIETLLQQGRQSTDPTVRAKAYQQIAQQLNKDLPYIWNDRATWAIVANSKVQNFNNPVTPDNAKAYGMIVGTIWTPQIWLNA